MSRSINWIPLVERFQKRLSKWKVNSLSFRGRLTLIKSVLGSLGVYFFSTFKAPKKIVNKLEGIRRRFFCGGNVDEDKISWIAWNKVVSPWKNGGLGIGSLMESNQSLLAKWWCRFRVEENIIWCKVIRSIHGPTGVNLSLLFKKKIGDGKSTRFWHNNWLGGNTLREAFPLLYQLETKNDCYVFERHGSVVQNSHTSHGSVINLRINDGLVTPWAWRRRPRSFAERLELTDIQNLLTNSHLSMDQDSWEFTQDSTRIFSVNSMRKTISNILVDPTSQQTRWNKLLPSKVNILVKRIANKRLPTRANLDKRGIDLDSILCPMCNNDIETESHILVSCPIAQSVWKDLFTWWKLSNSHLSALEDVFSLVDRTPLEKRLTSFFDVTVNTTMWSLWNYRNKVIFNLKRPQKELILNEIKLSSFNWISSRSKNISFSWIDWFNDPCNSLNSIL
ncbi:RNA-directed DNA polymerase, eukaryota, reverse transcriptase zinc-binding domain protein [Tanacetum coccineum]